MSSTEDWEKYPRGASPVAVSALTDMTLKSVASGSSDFRATHLVWIPLPAPLGKATQQERKRDSCVPPLASTEAAKGAMHKWLVG